MGSDWRTNFTHPWPLASGDYLGQLRRWLSVFPRERFFVGFYEDIAVRPGMYDMRAEMQKRRPAK